MLSEENFTVIVTSMIKSYTTNRWSDLDFLAICGHMAEDF